MSKKWWLALPVCLVLAPFAGMLAGGILGIHGRNEMAKDSIQFMLPEIVIESGGCTIANDEVIESSLLLKGCSQERVTSLLKEHDIEAHVPNNQLYCEVARKGDFPFLHLRISRQGEVFVKKNTKEGGMNRRQIEEFAKKLYSSPY